MKQALLDYAAARDNFKGDWKHTNDNEVLFHFHLVIEALLAGELTQEDLPIFREQLENFYESVKVVPGLTKRAPNHTAIDSFDNELGWCLASMYLDGGKIAKEMALYDMEHGCNRNNPAPDKWKMEAQMPLFNDVYVHLACGYRPSVWSCLGAGIGLLFASQGNMFRIRGLILEKYLHSQKGKDDWPIVVLNLFWSIAKNLRPNSYRVQRLANYYSNQEPWKSELIRKAGGRWI